MEYRSNLWAASKINAINEHFLITSTTNGTKPSAIMAGGRSTGRIGKLISRDSSVAVPQKRRNSATTCLGYSSMVNIM